MTTYYWVPKGTTFFLFDSDTIAVLAVTNGHKLEVGGRIGINVIEFADHGFLNFTIISAESNAEQRIFPCSFFAYNYSSDGCDKNVIISGTNNYWVETGKYYRYCTLLIMKNGSIEITPENVRFNSLRDNGLLYNNDYEEKITAYQELSVYYTPIAKEEGGMNFKIDAKLVDYPLFIDGESERHYYKISESSSERMDRGEPIGKVGGKGFPPYLIAIIVVIVVIVIISIVFAIMCIFCRASLCCCSKSSSKSQNEENASDFKSAQDDAPL